MPASRRLTDAELELMHVLWDHGPGTVRDVMGHLPGDPPRAYTTVSTLLRILAEKGFVATTPAGRAHVYTPSLSAGDYQARHVQAVVRDVFRGDAVGLMRQLVSQEALDPAQVAELQRLVGELEP